MLSRTACGRPGALSVCYKLVELPATSPSFRTYLVLTYVQQLRSVS